MFGVIFCSVFDTTDQNQVSVEGRGLEMFFFFPAGQLIVDSGLMLWAYCGVFCIFKVGRRWRHCAHSSQIINQTN